MYDFVRGPLVWISFIVFFGGIFIQIMRFFLLSREKKGFPVQYASAKQRKAKKEAKKKVRFDRDKWRRWIAHIRATTVLGPHPFMAVLTGVFHFCLIVTPLLTMAHHLLLYDSFGVHFFYLSESTTDFLTIVFLICALIFLIRRLTVRQVRAVTTPYDYVILAVTVLPFLTGFLAYHQIFDYKTMIILHILSGEIMLIMIPFSKLVHMLYFFINRFFISGEYGFVRGSRVWS